MRERVEGSRFKFSEFSVSNVRRELQLRLFMHETRNFGNAEHAKIYFQCRTYQSVKCGAIDQQVGRRAREMQ